MELETDKAVVEVPSSVSGVVREVKVKEGQKVKVGAGHLHAGRRRARVRRSSAQARAGRAYVRTASGAALRFNWR